MLSRLFKKENRRALACAAYLVLVVLTLVFIFHNSSVSVEESGAQSDKVVDVVKPIVDPELAEKDWQLSIFVRKAAHLAEFALLGAELAFFAFFVSWGLKLRDLIYVLFAGVMVANVDELIQVYTRRGSSVTDVFLDMIGLVIGMTVGYAVAFAARALSRRISEKRRRGRRQTA